MAPRTQSIARELRSRCWVQAFDYWCCWVKSEGMDAGRKTQPAPVPDLERSPMIEPVATERRPRAGRSRRSGSTSPSESEAAAKELEEEACSSARENLEVRLTGEGMRTAEQVLRQKLRRRGRLPGRDGLYRCREGDAQAWKTSMLSWIRSSELSQRSSSRRRSARPARGHRTEWRRSYVSPHQAEPSRWRGSSSVRSVLERAAEGAGVPLLAHATRLIDAPARVRFPRIRLLLFLNRAFFFRVRPRAARAARTLKSDGGS